MPGENDGRLVFDIERQRFFFTIDYNWRNGFNPFYRVA